MEFSSSNVNLNDASLPEVLKTAYTQQLLTRELMNDVRGYYDKQPSNEHLREKGREALFDLALLDTNLTEFVERPWINSREEIDSKLEANRNQLASLQARVKAIKESY